MYSAVIERVNSFCRDGAKSLELSDRKGEVEESGTHSVGGAAFLRRNTHSEKHKGTGKAHRERVSQYSFEERLDQDCNTK